MTDTLQAVAENTAVPASSFTKGEYGKSMARRWFEGDKPVQHKETRTAEEIIEHIREKLKNS